MKIHQILKKYNNIEIELLLQHVLGKSKEFVLINSAHELTRIQTNKLTRMAARRLQGEPIAYILGHKDFYGLRFKVNKDVLIPRPETEWMVERVGADLIRPKFQDGKMRSSPTGTKIKILDIGTGSGAIIISVAASLDDAHQGNFEFYGSDISSAALMVAKQNAKEILKTVYIHTRLSECIQFIQSDLFRNITGKFDIIIANLPYVPLKVFHRHLLHKDLSDVANPFTGLKYEPSFALTDGTSSWQIYKRFFQEVTHHVNPGALILLEIDPASKKFLMEYQKKYLPEAKIKFYKDFNNFWRYAEIKF